MRLRNYATLAVLLCALAPSDAWACYLYKHTVFNAISPKMTFGGGVQIQPSDETGVIVSGDANFPIGGGKGTVGPAVGMCTSGDVSELIFGAAIAWQLWKDASGNNTLNLQSGLSYVSFDGGNSRTIPVGVGYGMKKSDKMSLYAGATALLNNDSYDTGSGSVNEADIDPVLYGGVMMAVGALNVTAGLGALKGDHDIDFAVNVAVSTSGGTNAMRNFFSRIRR